MKESKIHNILVPVDFSDYTMQVMDFAVMLARSLGSVVKLLHVVQMPMLPEAINWMAAGPPAVEAAIPQEFIKLANAKLAELTSRYQDIGVKIEAFVSQGVPFVEILQAVPREKIDLIVMGSHGRTGIKHILMGSVAERVVRKAPCPVLCVKPEWFKFALT